MNHPNIRRHNIQAMRAQATEQGHTLTDFHPEIDGSGLLACCKQCGRRVTLESSFRRYDEALHQLCEADLSRATESLAWLTGWSSDLLLKRLTEAVRQLTPQQQRFFDPGDYDPGNFCLMSEDGVWRLEWSLRQDPHLPVDIDNPQSPDGCVTMHRIIPLHVMFPARYIGGRQNPNVSDDPKLWLVRPLETETDGVAYPTPDGRWRFRRLEGVVGHFVSRNDLTFEVDDATIAAAADSYRFKYGEDEREIWKVINEIDGNHLCSLNIEFVSEDEDEEYNEDEVTESVSSSPASTGAGDAGVENPLPLRPLSLVDGPNTKGGRIAARQNFSMHPELMKAIFSATNQLSEERVEDVLDDRARRVTFSKIVAALAWLLKTRYLTPEGAITDRFRSLIANYEATLFERPDDTKDADAIMAARRLYADRFQAKMALISEEDVTEEAKDGGEEQVLVDTENETEGQRG